MTAWLGARNGGDEAAALRFYKSRYGKEVTDRIPPKELAAHLLEMFHEDGPVELVKVEESSESAIRVLLHAPATDEWLHQSLALDPKDPGRIVKSRPEPAANPGVRPARDDRELAAELDAFVSKLAADDRFEGAVLVERGDEVVYSRAVGLAHKGYGAPMKLDTKMNLGSMNKMFTSVCIAQLVAAGKLSYTDTLGKILPNYPNEAAAAKVTVHHLLTHTSGLGDYFNDKFEAMAKDKLMKVSDYLPLFASDPLAFEPGARFQYSNAGFMVLGAIVEKVSGEDYFSYVREHVYAPAGMTNTDAYEMDRDNPEPSPSATRTWGRTAGERRARTTYFCTSSRVGRQAAASRRWRTSRALLTRSWGTNSSTKRTRRRSRRGRSKRGGPGRSTPTVFAIPTRGACTRSVTAGARRGSTGRSRFTPSSA